MRLGFHGEVRDEPVVRVAFVGCGSHAFRNLYPSLQFAPIDLVAVCDLDRGRAEAFAHRFGAHRAYVDHRRLLEAEDVDAVLLCVGVDPGTGRPLYPDLALACLEAGRHVWMEKPPATTVAEIDELAAAAARAGRIVQVGFKKMFMPANVRAAELVADPGFGAVQVVTAQYPQYVPPPEKVAGYLEGRPSMAARGLLEHLCHPGSVLLLFAGAAESVRYERSAAGAAVCTFRYASGAIASLTLAHRPATDASMERTTIVGDAGRHITVENNLRVTLHRSADVPYGETASFHAIPTDEAAVVWEPEFSLGQLYNKGVFLLGYVPELTEFANAVLEERPPVAGTLDDAWHLTRLFEAFAEGPGRDIDLTRARG